MLESRTELREQMAELVNGLSRKELLESFAISRVADLTGLDVIGLPVYTTSRILSKTVAIQSGKGLSPEMSRAGAIMEAIEFEVADNPHGPFRMAAALQLPEEERLELADCFPIRASAVNDLTLLPWEEATNIQTGEQKLVPSELIWLVSRDPETYLMHLQGGTNGLASGGSVEDAILSGLYEILERDAWTIYQHMLDNFGILPKSSPLRDLPPRLADIAVKFFRAKIKLHLFDITNDYRVPVFAAVLLDHTGNVAGTFTGYGCHLNAEIAAIRAVTEAAQARCCYISGARDDMFRRQFLMMRRMDQFKLDKVFNDELPEGPLISEYRKVSFPDVRSELRYLLKLVKGSGVSEVYVKELGSALGGRVQVVRVFSPQCEPCKLDYHAPTMRCLSYARRKIEELKGDPEKEEWMKER